LVPINQSQIPAQQNRRQWNSTHELFERHPHARRNDEFLQAALQVRFHRGDLHQRFENAQLPSAGLHPGETQQRSRQALTLEEGVRRLTSDPAEVFGVRNRGRLAPGLAADVAVFDAARIGSTNRGERRFDLPGGAKRMVMPSRGVEYTVVNGVVTWAEGKLTGATAGQVLRS